MNHKQYQEFKYIVHQCEAGQYRGINVASKVRRDAVIAAWKDHRRLRELLREAVILFECDDECSDPSTAAWGWLQDARTALEAAVE